MMTNGSLQNLMMHNSSNPTIPSVGMGATEVCWTDRHAYTIVEIVNDKTIKVQRDKAIRKDNAGPSDCQVYEFQTDKSRPIETLVLKHSKKKTAWVRKGDSINGNRYLIGSRDEHYDYSF